MCSKVVIDIMQKRSEMVRVRVRISGSEPIRGTVRAGLHRRGVGTKITQTGKLFELSSWFCSPKLWWPLRTKHIQE